MRTKDCKYPWTSLSMRWRRWACAMINDVYRASHVDIEVHELKPVLSEFQFGTSFCVHDSGKKTQ
jgi:hypothetical protein